jgi:putative glutamine amidotransferase
MNKIGLLADIEDNKWSFNMAYMTWARRFCGNVELISPLDKDLRTDLDLLILPGGADVLPFRYGEHLKNGYCGMPNFRYEEFDMVMLPQYVDQETPIFGICRGLQTLNVHFKGSLHQHIFDEPNSRFRTDTVHKIRTAKGYFDVNSMHHQAIKKLGQDLTSIAASVEIEKKKPEKLRYIEGIRHNNLPIAAVQFHPEELCFNPKANQATEWVDNLVLSIAK